VRLTLQLYAATEKAHPSNVSRDFTSIESTEASSEHYKGICSFCYTS